MRSNAETTQCAIVAEPQMRFSSIKTPNLFVFGNRGPTYQMSPYYLYLLAERQCFVDMGMPLAEIAKIESQIKVEGGRLYAAGFAEAVQAMASRIRLSILLDTGGGPSFYQKNLETIQTYLNRIGGEFLAYGGIDVLSLGAQILAMVPKRNRFAHPLSKILFHLGEADPAFKISSHERRIRRREDRNELEELLLDIASPDKRADMKEFLRGNLNSKVPQTPDRQVVLTGKFAEQMGILRTMGATRMKNHFLEDHGIPELAIAGTEVAGFFDRLLVYEKECHEVLNRIMKVMEPDTK